jgi:LuxR family transcriptional regulator
MQPLVDLPRTLADLMEDATAGFAIALHVRFATPAFMFQTYPRAWLDEYSHDGLIARDPSVAWGFANEGHIAWSELAHADEAGVMKRAAEAGLRHGLAVSVLRDGSRSIGGFARPDREFTEEEAQRIEDAMLRLHLSTAAVRALPEGVRESLRRLSVAFTHP